MSSTDILNLLSSFLDEQSKLFKEQSQILKSLINKNENGTSLSSNLNEIKKSKNKKSSSIDDIDDKSTSTKKRRHRTAPDPNKPKPTLSGYVLYTKKNLPIVKEANPNLTPNEIMSLVGKQWQTAPDKEYFINLAKENRKAQLDQIASQSSSAVASTESDLAVSDAPKPTSPIKAVAPTKTIIPAEINVSILSNLEPVEITDDKKKKKKRHHTDTESVVPETISKHDVLNSASVEVEGEKKKKKKHKHKHSDKNPEV